LIRKRNILGTVLVRGRKREEERENSDNTKIQRENKGPKSHKYRVPTYLVFSANLKQALPIQRNTIRSYYLIIPFCFPHPNNKLIRKVISNVSCLLCIMYYFPHRTFLIGLR
jgi:hypothetical protein